MEPDNILDKNHLIERGSKTAKNGFKNKKDIANK